MPARAIASGTIAFGLVSIPCKLFPSVSPSDAIRFNNLHKECGTRLKYQFVCPKDERLVGRDEMVKGYEFAKGQFVTFDAAELEAVEEQSKGGIDITEFVPIEQVEPIYYAKAYYLAPDGGASRAYHLLAAALRKTGLVALAKYAARGKQYLVLLRPIKEGLIMQQLHYPAEVPPVKEVGIETAEVNEGELDLAIKLIEQGSTKTFRPEKYTDEVRARVEELISRKVDGEDITQVPAESPKTQVIDLMAALKQSLGMSGGGEAAAERKGPKGARGKGEAKAEEA
jgi:DNA end-binding protein Ku